jgi:hypothetical protein
MLTHKLADNLNRIGLVLGFFSFWFAAPEFIGEHRLKSWEQTLAAVLLRVPKAVERITNILFRYTALFIPTLVIIALFTSDWSMVLFFSPLSVALIIGLVLSLFFARFTLEGVVGKLANDSRVRQRALFLGAALFTVSFVLHFIATFQGSTDR